MKKCTFFSSVALVALMLIPQTINADCEFTKDLFPGQSADRTALEINANVTVGGWGTATTHTYSQISNLATSNPDVVKVYNQGGYDAVFFVGVGEATVTYTESWFSGGGEGGGGASGGGGDAGGGGMSGLCQTNHTIHYTVAKGTPNIYYSDPEKGDPVSEYKTTTEARRTAIFHLDTKVYTTTTTTGFPEMITSNLGADVCKVTSSNTDVATISARGGAVQPTGTIGETTITATWAGNDNWDGGSASYVLKVEKTKMTVSISFPQNQVSDTLGKVIPAQTPTLRPSVSPIRWWSSQPSIASVNASTGEITTHASGQTWIHAAFDEDDDYYAADEAYCLTVLKKDPKLSFAEEDVYNELELPFTPQAINNPLGVSIKTWESSDPSVAVVTADGSAITLHKTGATVISAKTDPDDPTYAYVTVSYSLHVTTLGLTVLGVKVTSLNADDILEDGKVSFNVGNRFLYLNGWNVDVSGMSDDIKNGVIKEELGMLTVMLTANSSIVGAEKCIYAPSSGVYIRSQSKKDTLILRADASSDAIAVWTAGLKMHEALFYTYGSQFAVMCGDFNVTKYGHVFAQSLNESGQAVMCTGFTKGEGGRGGIDILTYGVYWDKDKHAFWKGEKAAKLVEIGKVPLPISNDSVRDVSFKDESPEDNERIVFSENKDNQFNETSRELEITSTFTADSVDKSLNSITPGSAEWAEKMPGTLIMDVPTGEGTLDIACKTEAGYSLEVKVGNEDAQSVTQPNPDGSVEVDYNVSGQTRVIIYLRETGGSPSPRRVKADKKATPSATLKGITIKPKGAPTAVINTTADQFVIKRIVNGQLLIERDGKTYNVQGVQVQ
ncbi:MAG: hypothetical protein K6F10_02670 [Paludibacteraceae bacterium]|nr:hypothetical protein [Paludibacteraceae bacterium]